MTPDLAARAPVEVAVLPFGNEAVNLLGPQMLRKMVAERLEGLGYRPRPLDEVDEKLKGIGVSDGGQLPAYKPVEVGKALGVDGLFYGTVERFSNQNVGFYRQRVVVLKLRLVHAPSGERLWEAEGEGRTRRVAGTDEAVRAFLEGVIEQAAETAQGHPLRPEAEKAVASLLTSLPGR
ncbi:MAG: DUF799 family lipoprotein [Elusimicrobia bacterium]|nr:DUF799 family lipoprotein [Elusimicrobiota bacterium]